MPGVPGNRCMHHARFKFPRTTAKLPPPPKQKQTKLESTDGKQILRKVGGRPRDVFTSKDFLLLPKVCGYTGGAVALYLGKGLRKVDPGSNPQATQLEDFIFPASPPKARERVSSKKSTALDEPQEERANQGKCAEDEHL